MVWYIFLRGSVPNKGTTKSVKYLCRPRLLCSTLIFISDIYHILPFCHLDISLVHTAILKDKTKLNNLKCICDFRGKIYLMCVMHLGVLTREFPWTMIMSQFTEICFKALYQLWWIVQKWCLWLPLSDHHQQGAYKAPPRAQRPLAPL